MEERDDLEEQDDFKSKRIVYTIPAMEDAIIQKDITYKVVDDRELKLDVYYPPDYEGEARLPAVLFVHGDDRPSFSKMPRIGDAMSPGDSSLQRQDS